MVIIKQVKFIRGSNDVNDPEAICPINVIEAEFWDKHGIFHKVSSDLVYDYSRLENDRILELDTKMINAHKALSDFLTMLTQF